MSDRQVCPKISLLTDNDIRDLIAPVLLAWCLEPNSGPSRVGLDIGCEEKTVRRARDKEGTLKANTIFNMLAREGDALDPILAHFRRRSVPIDDISVDAGSIPSSVASCLPLLIELLRDNVCNDDDVRTLEKAGVIDRLAEAADMLRGRREALHLKDALR